MNMKIYTAFMALCMILSLTACGQKGGVDVMHTSVTEADSGEKAAPITNEEESSLEELIKMIGQSDIETKDLLGGGTENLAADDSAQIGRSYKSTLFGKEAIINTLYDDNGKINVVQAELLGIQLEDCQIEITKAAGSAMEIINSSEGGQGRGKWFYNGILIQLFQIGDNMSIELLIPTK